MVRERWRAWTGAGIALLVLAGCDVEKLPPPPNDPAAAERQKQDFVAAMKPPRPGRPVIAIVALNDQTETTDLLLPHAVLERADVADVVVVAPRPGRVKLYPSLQVDAEMDFAGFEQAHPRGADYVIVPAMEPADDGGIARWLRAQSSKGARVIGACVGALVVANAGLLDGRRYVSHWYVSGDIAKGHPSARFVPHQRYVADRGVATTTGITASVPTMLALVEAIGGVERARSVAADLGVDTWTPTHDSTRFGLDGQRRWGYIADKAAFWRREQRVIDVADGTDDVALAFAADAWSRTGLVATQATSARPSVRLRSGLSLATAAGSKDLPRVPLAAGLRPVQQLDRTLCDIASHFGPLQRDRVEQELEYPAKVADCG
jgi:putative intracellular protease/amidase